MISLKSLEQQLKQVGCNFRFWGRPEIIELSKILMPGETVAQCVNGQYAGGFALLCATDQRVLLVDKKPMYLTIEDIRFDMISDVNFNYRLLDATIQILTGVKTLQFTAYGQHRLRLIMNHIQQRITEVRRHQNDVQQAGVKLAEQIEQVYSGGGAVPPVIAVALTPPASQPTVAAPIANQSADFNGFQRQVAMQMAHDLGPRAVSFSQFPPSFNRYKLPLARRPFRTTTSTR